MRKNLEESIKKFSKAKILCVGDVMMDRFVQGKVERISPEAPVPVFQFVSERKMLGGAGNVVANISSLGAPVYFVSMVGKDAYGEQISELLDAIDANHYLLKSKNRPTVMKARFIAGSNHILRFDQEKIVPLTSLEEKELLTVLEKRLSKADIVLFSDYAKGLLSDSFCQKAIRLISETGKKVLIDPKGQDYSKYQGAFLIKPNRKELEVATGIPLDPKDPAFLTKVERTARIILDRYKIQNIVVTLSDKGMIYVPSSHDENTIYLSTSAREVFDVSGAGDTSLATLGIALACNIDISEATELANLAAGIVVGKLGTATVSQEELLTKLKSRKDE